MKSSKGITLPEIQQSSLLEEAKCTATSRTSCELQYLVFLQENDIEEAQ